MIPQPATRCVSAAKSAVPHVTDQAAALQLANFSKSAASALVNLRNAANRAGESFTALNVDNALDLLANVKGNLKDVERSVAEGTIKPLPRETVSILSLLRLLCSFTEIPYVIVLN